MDVGTKVTESVNVASGALRQGTCMHILCRKYIIDTVLEVST